VAGMVSGAHAVLSYILPPSRGNSTLPAGAPLQTLIGFEKVWLSRGGTSVVHFDVTLHDLTSTLEQGGRVAVPGDWTIVIGSTRTTLTVATRPGP
jgi:hypothetical protein